MRRLSPLLLLTIMTACTAHDADTPRLRLGVDTANFDRSVRPQDNFFRFVNGGWLDQTAIPEDKSTYGTFVELADQAESDIRLIVEQAAAGPHPAESDQQKIGDFYRAFLDTTRVDSLGLGPLQEEVDRVDAIRRPADVVAYWGSAQAIRASVPINYRVAQDPKEPTAYISTVSQGGLGLPDRDYYLDDKFADVREAYLTHVARILGLAGTPSPAKAARVVMAVETRLARAQWTRVQNRDREATYNKYLVSGADSLTPGISWERLLAAAGAEGQPDLIIRQPSYVEALAAALRDVPVRDWRLYHRWQLLDAYAQFLSRDFVDEDFAFSGKVLRGIDENRPRWKRGIAAVNAAMGELVGKVYVDRHFSHDAKVRMDTLVANLATAFRQAIGELSWMTDSTKAAALAKLDKFTPKIGYPEAWKDYADLEIDPDDLLGNVIRARRSAHARMLAKLGKPIDRIEWGMTPQTVNAYYSSSMNEVVFPAAILQPPFFDVTADDATNYGAIGAVIGHEFSHGFDDQGRKSDGDGRLTDWWTERDAKEFQTRADGLVRQYNGYSPIEGMTVNGELTLGENIGDLAGMAMAYRAYRLSLGGREAPVIDGFTGDQRFYLGWAQIWRRLYRTNELKRRLVTDPHAPAEYRVNGIVANLDPFYAAFDVHEGDGMYVAPDQRVRIW